MDAYLDPYVEPVGAAAALFPVLVLVTLVPFALFHYRRFGRVHPWRALVSYSMVFYLLVAAFLVSLPLPDLPAADQNEAWRLAHSRVAQPQLDPTAFLSPILETHPGVSQNRAILQAVFNGVLLLPFGFYLVYAFRRGLVGAWAGGLALSLGFELSQWTGLFGVYPGPYRLFDTGDLVLNSAGALIGGVVAKALLQGRLLPALDQLPAPDTPWIGAFRRGLATALDSLAVGTVTLGVLALAGWTDPVTVGWVVGTVVALVFIVIPTLAGGQSLGRWVTLCTIATEKGSPAGALRSFARQGLLWGPFVLALLVPQYPAAQVLGGLLWVVGGLVNAAGAVFDKEHAGWIDRWLGTRIRNTWTPRRKSRSRARVFKK